MVLREIEREESKTRRSEKFGPVSNFFSVKMSRRADTPTTSYLILHSNVWKMKNKIQEYMKWRTKQDTIYKKKGLDFFFESRFFFSRRTSDGRLLKFVKLISDESNGHTCLTHWSFTQKHKFVMTGLMRHSLSKLGMVYMCVKEEKALDLTHFSNQREEVSKWSLKKILIIYNMRWHMFVLCDVFFFSLSLASHTYTKNKNREYIWVSKKSFGFDSLLESGGGVKMVFEKNIDYL